MGGDFFKTRVHGIFAAIVVLFALAPAAADQLAVAPPPPSFDVTPPKSKHMLDFDAVKRSNIRNSGKFDKQQKDSSGIALPDRVDLGTSKLRLDADRSAVSSGPRVGVDSHDPSFLSRSTRKDAPALNYFGLTLTTPTH